MKNLDSFSVQKFPRVLAVFRWAGYLCDFISTSCTPTLRFVALAQARFNFSLFFYNSDLIPGVGMNKVDHALNPHSLFIGGESYLAGYRAVGPGFAPYIRGAEKYYALYCENGWRTEADDSYSQWTAPFDLNTWGMVWTTALGVAVIGAKFKGQVGNQPLVYNGSSYLIYFVT